MSSVLALLEKVLVLTPRLVTIRMRSQHLIHTAIFQAATLLGVLILPYRPAVDGDRSTILPAT
ncbi:hypothetical protein T11_5949, partial [Trichinella zimbabwensis]